MIESEYLSENELADFIAFLKARKISKAALARKVRKEPATAGYWLRERKMKRLIARDFIAKEKEQALSDFKKVEKI